MLGSGTLVLSLKAALPLGLSETSAQRKLDGGLRRDEDKLNWIKNLLGQFSLKHR
jgi:hypothetical protein